MKSTPGKYNLNIINSFNDIDTVKWRDLLENSSHASIFQTPEFVAFINGCDGYSGFILAGERDDKYLILVYGFIQYSGKYLMKRISSRAIIYGGPVIRDDDVSSKDVIHFFRSLNDLLSKKTVYTEIRNFSDYSYIDREIRHSGFKYESHLDIIVDTGDINTAFARFSESKRRQIKQAIKSGAEIFMADSEDQVRDFYLLLKDLYKKRVKKPLPPVEFFIRFFHEGPGTFLLVRYKSGIIGGIMCPAYKDKTVYEWYIAGDDEGYKKLYPSTLATYAAIKYAADNGIQRFDFMGAGSPAENYGVRAFKSKFGGEEIDLGRYLHINNKLIYFAGKTYFDLRNII